jgi:hypothetical protein
VIIQSRPAASWQKVGAVPLASWSGKLELDGNFRDGIIRSDDHMCYVLAGIVFGLLLALILG